MKSLHDIKQDMSDLYNALSTGAVDIKVAGELANIAGKFLKAEQLELAKAVFINDPVMYLAAQDQPPALEHKEN